MNSTHLLEYTDMQGEIRWPEHNLAVTCNITVAHDGTMAITTMPFRLNADTAWVLGSRRLALTTRPLPGSVRDSRSFSGGRSLRSDHRLIWSDLVKYRCS
jgi:hypothetical protein